MIVAIILLVTIIGSTAMRGPHHPRGETVMKRHAHYTPNRYTDPQKLTQDEQLLHDTAHIQEHLEDISDQIDVTKMTEEELEFYYFHLHDSDKNAKLDGLEILQAVYHTSHFYEEGAEAESGLQTDGVGPDGREDDFNYYVELIDNVLAEDDTNADGYLSYPEYVAGRKKDIQHVLRNQTSKT